MSVRFYFQNDPQNPSVNSNSQTSSICSYDSVLELNSFQFQLSVIWYFLLHTRHLTK